MQRDQNQKDQLLQYPKVRISAASDDSVNNSIYNHMKTNTLPRPERPRQKSGYVSPAERLRKTSKMDLLKNQCKGFNLSNIDMISDVFAPSVNKSKSWLV